jgi:hypothetical protein
MAQRVLAATESRSQPRFCGARAPSRASRAAIFAPPTGSRFHVRRIGWSDAADGPIAEICAATLWWTIVVLRDGRRVVRGARM